MQTMCNGDRSQSRVPGCSLQRPVYRRWEKTVRRTSLLFVLVAMLTPWAHADDATDRLPVFVRFQPDGHGGGQMQSAFASYTNADGVKVDLLSTMHIGEAGFFKQLNDRLDGYDAVLYELVAPRGVPATEEGVNDQQRQIATDCHLDNQGPHMDYRRKNFVHADLSLEQIEKLEVAQHGTFKGALGDGPGLTAAKDENDTAGLTNVLADLKAAKKFSKLEHYRLMRRAYGEILAYTAMPATGKTAPADMEVIVGARDDLVQKILQARVKNGKKHLAILYGAAHMVDLEDRLMKLGFKRTNLEWETAWTVEPDGTPTTQPAQKPAKPSHK